MADFKIITGDKFKKKYLSTDSGFFEHVRMTASLGCALGRGFYLSVSEGSAFHYSNSEYADCDIGTISYWMLADEAKIMLVPNAQNLSNKVIRAKATRLKVDGAFDPNEHPFGRKTSPYLGLVIYNKKVISCAD